MNLLGYALTTVTIGIAAVFLVSPVLHQLPGMHEITVHCSSQKYCWHQAGSELQGDPSRWTKPPIDIKPKVPFKYEANELKRNLCFGVNGRFEST